MNEQTKTDELRLSLKSLAVFRGLLDDGVVMRLSALLDADGLPVEERVSRYADFAAALYACGGNLTAYLLAQVLEDDNAYARACARRETVPAVLADSAAHELAILERLSQLTPEQARKLIGYEGYLPGWETHPADFAAAYEARARCFGKTGYGVFAKSHMLRLKDGVITPVRYPDPVRLADLKGYERQKRLLLANTRALLDGRGAVSALLYGDAGTGKSSTVKALANEYSADGLRLIEVPKSRFHDIPAVADMLAESPLKFILFIDDLSFGQQSEDFNALKAVLEGSVSARTQNVVIYATSNRRHIVKELFSEREAGDDVHRGETIQELVSLSHRFALTVGFFRPDRETYLDIVHALADEYGIVMDQKQLDAAAERFASAGRSPRAARQFIDSLRRGSGLSAQK